MVKIILAVVASLFAVVYAAPQKEYPLKLQPELDSVDVDGYLKNERLLKLQIKCLLDEAPCDIVGRWLKPRVAKALQGECLQCTEKQKGRLESVLLNLLNNKSEVYREAFAKIIAKAGLKPEDLKWATTTTTTTTTTAATKEEESSTTTATTITPTTTVASTTAAPTTAAPTTTAA